MGSVDNRIVNMQFNNREFEKNINTSINSLDSLKKSLDFKGTEKSFEETAKSSSILGNAVEDVKLKFNALDIMAITALTRITNAAISTGTQLAKSLSIDQISAGWSKFEKKANSVSTLVAQGFDLETVEEQVEKLNWFSDETSYNFTDMVDNVAKFTAAGRSLPDSTVALQGIALWAAKSGKNANEASRAFYQLSQAMGSGVMKRQDWMSMTNLNMDTIEFKQMAIDTAVELGRLKKNVDGTYTSLRATSKAGEEAFSATYKFADSLTEGLWFDADVMMKTYEKYGKGAEQVKKIVDAVQDNFNTEIWTSEILRMWKALNGLDKSGTTFEDIISEHGYSETMGEALRVAIMQLDEFGVKALQAGQEYRTFTDVLDATRDAVSTKWMNIFETILGNLDDQKALWTSIGDSLYTALVVPLTSVETKLKQWVELGRTRKSIQRT